MDQARTWSLAYRGIASIGDLVMVMGKKGLGSGSGLGRMGWLLLVSFPTLTPLAPILVAGGDACGWLEAMFADSILQQGPISYMLRTRSSDKSDCISSLESERTARMW